MLIDASNLGTTVKEDKNQKTVLSTDEEDQIIKTFNDKEVVDDFSVVVSYEDVAKKNYSLSAGQYFEVKIEYVDISKEEYESQLSQYEATIKDLFSKSRDLESKIENGLKGFKYE